MKTISMGVFIILLCCLWGVAFAGGTAGFPVSCTIPVIPGVNVPLLVDEREETKEIIRQDTQAASVTVAQQVVVQTFYAR